jgi:hypothetical protein
MSYYYHGSDFEVLEDENPSTGCFDICLTKCERTAKSFATRFGAGFVHEFWFDGEVTSQADALAMLGVESDYLTPSDIFHAIDCGVKQLKAAGVKAVEYIDQIPGTADTYTTVRVFESSAIKHSETNPV